MKASWLALGLVAASISSAPVASGHPDASPRDPLNVARVQSIAIEASGRYVRSGGGGLAVTEASSTGVIESFTLLSANLVDARSVPAANGVYYAICPPAATCPYPARPFARSPATFHPRRLALELAVRTFRETSADVVAVSLPAPRFVLFVVERAELADVGLSRLAAALARNPVRVPSRELRELVDRTTRPRVYAVLGLEPTPSGGEALGAVPVWPGAGAEERE